MIKRMVIASALAFGICAASAFAEGSADFIGSTWYVDASAAAGGKGTSAASAFNTIDAAITEANSLDKIVIAAGRYVSTNATTTLGRTNIYIDGKKLWLCGAGRTATYIIGQHDATGTGGVGADAVRCVTITGAGAAGSIFEKMTFLKGATASGSAYGGVYADSDATGVIFVDCTFRQCASDTLAGAAGGANEKFIRCLFDGNWCSADRGGAAVAKGIAGCYNCIFMRNIETAAVGHPIGKGTTCNFVNCDFIGNEFNAIPDNASYGSHYNGVFLGSHYSSGTISPMRQSICSRYCVIDVTYGSLSNENGTFNYKNYNCVTGTVKSGTSTTYLYSRTNTAYCIFSPLTFKFNPIPNSPLIKTGNPEYLGGSENKIAWVPTEYQRIDYEGQPQVVDGKCGRGPVERVLDSTAAPVRVDKNLVLADYEGSDIVVNRYLWYRCDQYPSAERLTVAEGVPYKFYDSRTVMHFLAPDVSNMAWKLSHAWSTMNINWATLDGSGSDSGACSMSATMANSTKWADPKLTDYTYADGSEEHPYKTLQEAIDASSAGGVVLAKSGTYEEGYKEVTDKGKGRVVIANNLRVLGVEGAEKTIIKGAFNNDATNERTGANAVRGVMFTGGDHVAVCGFTITGCATIQATSDSVSPKWGGGAAMGDNNTKYCVLDCVISNNYAFTAPAIYSAWAQRCFITDNHEELVVNGTYSKSYDSYGAVGNVARLSSCLVFIDTHTGGRAAGLASDSRVYGCTIRGSIDSRSMDNSSYMRYNTIFLNGGNGDGQRSSSGNSWYSNITFKEIVSGFAQYAMNADPCFVDPDNEDYRLMSVSPAITSSIGNSTDTDSFYYTVGTIDGQSPIFDGAKTRIGCYAEHFASYASCAGMNLSGTNVITSTEPITFTFTNPTKRPFKEMRVKEIGEDEKVVQGEGGMSCSYTWTPTDLTDDGVVFTPVYDTNWYVNATSGNDTTGNGFTIDTPMKTLAGIFDNPEKCEILSGDVVHAAEGTYDEGEMTNTAGQVIGERVAVPAGVTLKADGSRENTIIRGRWHSDVAGTSSQWNSRYYTNAKGCQALRCVKLNSGSVIDGFTITHGSGTAYASVNDASTSGGCVYGTTSSYVKNCIITEGGGRYAGGVYGCIVENCYLYDHDSSSWGTSSAYSKLINCVIYNLHGSAVEQHFGIYNSTIYSLSNCEKNTDLCSYDGSCPIENSILLMQFYPGSKHKVNTLKNLHNCILWPATTKSYNATAAYVVVDPATCYNVQTQNLAWCQLDANNYFAPLSGSPVIDAGDRSLVEDIEAVMRGDFFGGQRIYNGEIDIGAGEYDWRADYRDVLRFYRLSVAAASEDVKKVDNTITIPNGDKIVIGVDEAAGFIANFEIPEGGELTITDNSGETIATLDSSVDSYEFTGQSEITLAYAGSTAATLMPFTSNVGLTIIIK